MPPDIRHRQHDIFGESARPVHADAQGVRAKMAAPGQAVPAAPAGHMPFAADDIARMKIVDVRANFDNFAHELMTDRHRNGNRALRPIVPVINVNVGAANARAPDTNEDVVDSGSRRFNLLEPQSGLAPAFDQSFHDGPRRPRGISYYNASRTLALIRASINLQRRSGVKRTRIEFSGPLRGRFFGQPG